MGVVADRRGPSGWVLGAGLGVLVLVAALAAGAAPAAPPYADGGDRILGVRELAAPPVDSSWAAAPRIDAGLRTLATSGPGGFALRTDGGERRFLPGVNLGSTTPGHQPGELAIGAADYRAWFGAMRRLGIRVVRVYTIHPPAFYAELAAHNRAHPAQPLYLMHGVYLPDEAGYLHSPRGLYDAAGTRAFTDELRDASDAVSGLLRRPPTPGRAAGAWTVDVSPWLAGWIVGVEWDPLGTARTDRAGAAAPAAGRYFRAAAAASPTERWIAARMDELAAAEAARGRSAPMAFVNWPTTDPLRHPHEALAREDLVGIDANHVQPTAAWPGGTFASYHAYPYYPDFLHHEPALQRFRHQGRPDPYAGYLDALRRHHGDMPLMVTEFGVPSAIGKAHSGTGRRHQGDHSERDAMVTDARMLRMLRDLGLAGGFVFAWTDEWFKFTWNTIAHQQPPDRRGLWHDPLTNEQYFGLVATDPLGAEDAGERALAPAAGGAATAAAYRVDESYLHLRIRLAPEVRRVSLGLDTVAALTGPPPPGGGTRAPDAAVTFTRDGPGQVWVREALDPVPLDYARAGERPPARAGWRPYQLIVNRALTVPLLGRRLAAEYADVGLLRAGEWTPGAPGADSRHVWRWDGDTLVARLPWALIGFSDPSSHRVLVPRGRQAGTVVAPDLPLTLSADGGPAQALGAARWESWQRVRYVERLKPGWSDVRDAMRETAR